MKNNILIWYLKTRVLFREGMNLKKKMESDDFSLQSRFKVFLGGLKIFLILKTRVRSRHENSKGLKFPTTELIEASSRT